MSELASSARKRFLVDHSGNKGIGDIVCELNYYRALRGRFPEAELVSRGSRRLAWGNPLVDRFDESSPDEAFEVVIRQESLGSITSDLKRALRRGDSIFDLFLRHQGFEVLPGRPELYVLPRELADLRGLEGVSEDRLVIAYSADSKEPDRRWGQERFQALARYLEGTYGAVLVEIGSGLTEGHLGVGLDFVGRTDLRQTMALLSRADLFVGNNGGLTHLAGGIGTPALVPWGANSPYEAYAYDDLSVALGTAPPCQNCGWTGVFLPECLEVDPVLGRTPCTQEIELSDMQEAADDLIPRILEERATWRQRKRERSLQARDPLTLPGFEREVGLAPFARLHLSMGGEPGWFEEHRPDHFRRLNHVVALPDWSDSAWKPMVAAYVRACEATSPWVLFLAAYPLTGPQVRAELEAFIAHELRPTQTLPKVLVVIGSLSVEERQQMLDQAALILPDGHSAGAPEKTLSSLDELVSRMGGTPAS